MLGRYNRYTQSLRESNDQMKKKLELYGEEIIQLNAKYCVVLKEKIEMEREIQKLHELNLILGDEMITLQRENE